MSFYRITFLYCLLLMISITNAKSIVPPDYLQYHSLINDAEKLISEEKFVEASAIYKQVFTKYDFIFVRDFKVAAQLALYLNEKQQAFDYVEKGILAGWELKAIKKNQFLKPLHDDPEWNMILYEYNNLHKKFLSIIDLQTREEVRAMFKKDQWKAIGALFRIGEKAQQKYGVRKFAPHSEKQMAGLIGIMNKSGYPGERLIGNDYWMSTIISHHNSITQEYAAADTLYSFIKPILEQALGAGQISPYEFAIMDDWQIAVASDRAKPGYGFLVSPKQSTISETNQLRSKVGLRSIELRNKLVEIEQKTGMNFYLPDWVNGKIMIE